LDELQRVHCQVRGAVAPRYLEFQLRLPCRNELHTFVRKRRRGDVAAQLLQPLGVVCFDSHCGVQTEAVDFGAQGLSRRGLTPCKVNNFWPARGSKAMWWGTAAASNCRRAHDSSQSTLGMAR